MVDEAILASVLRRNEPKALGIIEPLHFSRVAHAFLSFFRHKTDGLPIGTRSLSCFFGFLMGRRSHSLTPQLVKRYHLPPAQVKRPDSGLRPPAGHAHEIRPCFRSRSR